jgi:hypothetical protein
MIFTLAIISVFLFSNVEIFSSAFKKVFLEYYKNIIKIILKKLSLHL